MKTNIGDIDKIIRLSLAIIIGILYYTETISGVLAVVLGIFAGIFFITSFIGFCPLYKLFGINTCHFKNKR